MSREVASPNQRNAFTYAIASIVRCGSGGQSGVSAPTRRCALSLCSQASPQQWMASADGRMQHGACNASRQRIEGAHGSARPRLSTTRRGGTGLAWMVGSTQRARR